jgi:diadenylate cyclase
MSQLRAGAGDGPMVDITEEILAHSIQMASKIGARAVLVYADVFDDHQPLPSLLREPGDVPVFLAAVEKSVSEDRTPGVQWIRVPEVNLTQTSQIKIAVLLGLSRGYFSPRDTLVCLSGVAGTGALDTILIMQVGDEFELFAATAAGGMAPHVNPEVFERVLGIATSLGYEGREGKPVGTTFVIGDAERVLALSAPMVLNPFHGYAFEQRNVLDPRLEPTVKEFAAIDGAFVIRADGVIEAAGMYLKPEVPAEPLPRGFGARHNSAAGITGTTNAVAVTVSESTGTVTVFRSGRILIEVESPRPVTSWTQRRGQPFPGFLHGTVGTEEKLPPDRAWKFRDP